MKAVWFFTGFGPGQQPFVFEKPHPDVLDLGRCYGVTVIARVFAVSGAGGEVNVLEYSGPIRCLHIHEMVRFKVDTGQAFGVETVIVFQQLGLAGAVRVDKDHGEVDAVRQLAGEFPGIILVEARRSLDNGTATGAILNGEFHGHAVHIRFGNGADGEQNSIGAGGVDNLCAVLRRQVVLRLQNLLHPAGDAADLAVDGIGDIVIPIYLDGTLLDEVIVGAQQRRNLRSGGR